MGLGLGLAVYGVCTVLPRQYQLHASALGAAVVRAGKHQPWENKLWMLLLATAHHARFAPACAAASNNAGEGAC